MAQLPILEFPDARLRTKAAPVEAAQLASEDFQRLVDDMFETMYAAPGIGLAATQVDAHHRFMVIDVSEGKDQPMVFVNPEIQLWGTFDSERGQIRVHETAKAGDEDLPDLAILHTLSNSGQVYPVERSHLPDGSALAAVFRY